MIRLKCFICTVLFLVSSGFAVAQEYRCTQEKTINYYDFNKEESVDAIKKLKKYSGYFYAKLPKDFFDSENTLLSEGKIFNREDISNLGFERVEEATAAFLGASRNILFYDFPSGPAKLVRWNLLKDEATLCIPRQLINYKNDKGFVGTIRLNQSESSADCFWKAVVVNEETFMQSDFFMATSCIKDKPKLSFGEFLKEFQSILRK